MAMNITSKLQQFCVFLVIFIVISIMFYGLVRNVFNPFQFRNIKGTGYSNQKTCQAMFNKTKQKLTRLKTTKYRPPLSRMLPNRNNTNLFVRNMANGGRLGNKLFELAGVFGVAKYNGRIPILQRSTWLAIDQYFDTHVGIDNLNETTTNFLTFLEQKCYIRIKETMNLPQRNVTIGLFLLSRLYFEDAESDLRQELKFKPEVLKSARQFLNQSQSGTVSISTRVVIHIRRGDYFRGRLQTLNFTDLGSNYFLRSMSYFRQCYDRVQFVVLSDDTAWCKKNIVGEDVIYSEGHSPGVDLAVAFLCDHAIITYGTYSAWVTWFANGITIRPRNLAIANSMADLMYRSATGIYPSDTIAL